MCILKYYSIWLLFMGAIKACFAQVTQMVSMAASIDCRGHAKCPAPAGSNFDPFINY